jgi:uncharacterized membrane protein
VQIVVLGFDDLKFEDEIIGELRRLRSLEVVRLVDAVIVTKSNSGELVQVKVSDPTQEFSQLGTIAGALVGLGTAETESSETGGSSAAQAQGFLGDERTWSVAEVIPPGKMAVVALLEHRWAIPIRDAVHRAGGGTLADAWVHPDDLATYAAIAAAGEGQTEAPS